MYRSLAASLVAIVLTLCASLTKAEALNVNDEFHQMIGTQTSPVDSLFVDLGEGHISCFLRFAIARLSKNDPTAETQQSQARQCQADKLQSGNSAISKLRNLVPQPAAQSALKELAFYWRMQLAEVSSPHSDEEEVEILRRFKYFVERIRIETEW